MQNKNQLVEIHKTTLNDMGVEGVSKYAAKLEANLNNENRFKDLLYEGYSAALFARSGFSVTMQDRPDLSLQLDGIRILAEVRHFCFKDQDRIDEKRMTAARVIFPRYGYKGTSKEAWEEVFDVIIEKMPLFSDSCPNILIFPSSSPHYIEHDDVETAKNNAEQFKIRELFPGLRRLNGIFYMNPLGWSCLFQSLGPRIPLIGEIGDRIKRIADWRICDKSFYWK